MAGEELAEQLATLGEALKRLEGELARDASWCAFHAAEATEATRAELRPALEANAVYLAWRNMREAMAMLEARQAGRASPEAAADSNTGRMATLAEALQQLPPEETEAEPLPDSVAQVLAAHVAAEVAPTLQTPQQQQEQEEYDVGRRATQAVERILAIPVVEPIAPRVAAEPAHQPTPAAAAEPAAASAPAETVSTPPAPVPEDAEDLAFLLKPAARVQPAEQSPFLTRLVAETSSTPATTAAIPPADPFMVPPASEAAAPPPAEEKPATPKPGLARLLKAWSRH